ncbi:TPK1, partial [Acrasis kona]
TKFRKNDFEFGDVLGEGAFGQVRLCSSKNTDRKYAVKILKMDQLIKAKQTKYVKSERDILQLCDHPNICKLFYTFADEKKLYFVMELISGGELFSVLRKLPMVRFNVAQFYAAELLEAILFIHEKNIVHRDLKPENLLLSSDGHLKLVDFGIAKVIESDTMNTICGTVEYLSPELVTSSSYGKGVDWWAYGCILYELHVGNSPFFSTSMAVTCQKIKDREIYWPPDLHKDAKDLIDKLLTKDLNQRLGCGPDRGKSIRNHSYFEGINFNDLCKRKPPIVPEETGNEISGVGFKLSADNDMLSIDNEMTIMHSNVMVPEMRSIHPGSIQPPSDINPSTTDIISRSEMLRKLSEDLSRLPERKLPPTIKCNGTFNIEAGSHLFYYKRLSSNRRVSGNKIYASSPSSKDKVCNSSELSLRHIHIMATLQAPVRCISWSEKGDMIACSSSFMTNVYQTTSSSQDSMQFEFKHSKDTGSTSRYLSFSDNGKYIANDMQRDIGLLRFDNGKKYTYKNLRGHGMPITHLSWKPKSEDGLFAASGLDTCVYIWNAKKAKQLAALRGLGHESYITSLSWQKDHNSGGGRHIASGGVEGVVSIIDYSTEKVSNKIQKQGGPITGLTWRDENTLASWSYEDRSVVTIDMHSGKAIKHTVYPSSIISVEWSADGSHLVVVCRDMIRLWTYPDMKLVRTFHRDGGVEPSASASFDFESKKLAFTIGSDDVAPLVYDLSSNTMIDMIPSQLEQSEEVYHKAAITTVKWSHTKPLLATGSYDRTVRFWGCEEIVIENLDDKGTKFLERLDSHEKKLMEQNGEAENEESEYEDLSDED